MLRSIIWYCLLLTLSVTAYRLPFDTSSDLSDAGKYAAVCNNLGYQLQRVQSSQPGNQLLSPYGVSAVLSALYEGARGVSLEQLGRFGYVSLEQQGNGVSRSFQRLRRYLQRSREGSQLETATALLYPSGYSILSRYQQLLRSTYQCLVQEYDDIGEGEEGANRWIEEETKGRIPRVGGDVGASSGLTFLSGVYYQGSFESASPARQTQQLFYNEGTTSPVSVLSQQVQSTYPYYQDQQIQAVQIPYRGEEYRMLVLLPREQNGLRQLQQQLSYSTLQNILRGSYQTQVRVSIPQFTLDYSRNLKEDIRSLGITSVFGGEADLSGIAAGESYVSQIAQRAVVKVGDYGSEQQYQYEAGQEEKYDNEQQYQYEAQPQSRYGSGQRVQYRGPQQYGAAVGEDRSYESQHPYGYRLGQGELYTGQRRFGYETGRDEEYEARQQYGYGGGQGGRYAGQRPYGYGSRQSEEYRGPQQYGYGVGQDEVYDAQQQQYGFGKYAGQQPNGCGLGQGEEYEGCQLFAYGGGDEYNYQTGRRQYRGREEGYSYNQGVRNVVDLQVDRPFLFYIIHNPTGLNLLAGRVSQL